MSISLPLVKSFTTHPLYHGRAIGPRCDRVTIQIPSARSIEPNLNICRNFFPRKFELSNICKNLYKHFQSGFQESVAKTVAAATGYSASDGSSKSDGIKKQEKIELRVKIPEEPKLKNDGGPHIEDGDNKGGNGHGGDGKGNNNKH